MLRYTGKRLIYLVFVFLIVSALMFFIYKAVPGDPVLMMMEGNRQSMTPEQFDRAYEKTKRDFGLDQPLIVQYFSWLGNMLRGNFGNSIAHKRPVADVIAGPLKNTLFINTLNLLVVFAIAFPLGIRCAVRKNGSLDRIVQTATIVAYALPSMVVAIVFIYFFAVRLGLFPISGMNTPGFQGTGMEYVLDRLKYSILPLITMVFVNLGGILRYVRASMIDALSLDCVRTARSKGMKEKTVVYSHAFRNALLPLINIITGWIISVFSGSAVIERIFLYNGMGNTMIVGLYNLDFAIVLTMQMFYVVLSLFGNLIMDLLYAVADPRVKLS